MHICFLCDEYPPGLHGGLGSVTQTLARGIVKEGHRVSVIGMYQASRVGVEDDQGIQVVRLPHSTIPSTGFVVNGRRMSNALKVLNAKNAIDIIEGPELSLANISGIVPGTKIIRLHGGHSFFSVTLGHKPNRWRQWVERRSLIAADAVCSVSRFVAEMTRSLVRLGSRPIQVLPNPVDTKLFYPRPHIAEQVGRILFFGSLCQKKGIRELIQAMPLIIKAVPEAELWVVGRDTRDPGTGRSYQEALVRQIPKELSAHIHFKGPIEHRHLPEVIAACSVCVCPSHMESQGVVLLEAMAMAKPVVASGIDACRETVDDGVTALLVDPHSPGSIADATIRLLTDASLRRRLGEAGFAKVAQQFSLAVMVKKNIEYYEKCLRGGRVAA